MLSADAMDKLNHVHKVKHSVATISLAPGCMVLLGAPDDLQQMDTASAHAQPLHVCNALQVQGCAKSLNGEKAYYKRYSICEEHLRSLSLMVDGTLSRFCFQCGKFEGLENFEGDKRCAQLPKQATGSDIASSCLAVLCGPLCTSQ